MHRKMFEKPMQARKIRLVKKNKGLRQTKGCGLGRQRGERREERLWAGVCGENVRVSKRDVAGKSGVVV